MKYIASNTHRFIFSLFCCALLALACSGTAQAQASSSYKGAGRDPLYKPKPKPLTVVKAPKKDEAPVPVTPPAIQERINQYKSQKEIAMSSQQPAPKPTSALLLSEIDVTGIALTPRGYGAWVVAKPIKLTIIIYPGEMFWDGQLVGVEENRLVFRRDVRWSNNKVTTSVEMKQVRPPVNVSDPTAARGQSLKGK